MSQNISTFGIGAYLTASQLYPIGIFINIFSDEEDGIMIQETEIAGSVLDLNGRHVSFKSANPIEVTICPIPHSIDDDLLAVLLNSNRANANTQASEDVISLVVNYPDGTIRTFTGGRVLRGTPGTGTTAVGRLSNTRYTFAFEDMVTVNVASALNFLTQNTNIIENLVGNLPLPFGL